MHWVMDSSLGLSFLSLGRGASISCSKRMQRSHMGVGSYSLEFAFLALDDGLAASTVAWIRSW